MSSKPSEFLLPNWPSVHSEAAFKFNIRECPQDFLVIEDLGFEPSGEGEHLLLWIEKRNLNTLQVREYLAQQFKVPAHHVGYSGLKDKVAVTQQWFSLPKKVALTIAEPIALGQGEFKILRAEAHHRKLKIGTHKFNRFELILRDIKSEDAALSFDELAQQLNNAVENIQQVGFPNYFGAQRFGHNAGNIPKALVWFAEDSLFSKEKTLTTEKSKLKKISREKRSLYLSSARSFIFNELLAARVKQGTWNQYQADDKLILSGSQSYFSIDAANKAELNDAKRRLEEGDVSIAGPMLGRIEDLSENEKSAIEQSEHKEVIYKLIEGLKQNQAKTLYRAFSIIPNQLSCVMNNSGDEKNKALLRFSLPKGAFATALLKEIGEF